MCDNCMTDGQKIVNIHPQVVADPQPEYKGPGPHFVDHVDVVTVDEDLHDLLQVLWAKGFHTQFSCQGGEVFKDGTRTQAYILFETVDMGIKFFRETAKRASKVNRMPKLYLETSLGLSPDMSHLGPQYPNRCTVRFHPHQLDDVKAAWGL